MFFSSLMTCCCMFLCSCEHTTTNSQQLLHLWLLLWLCDYTEDQSNQQEGHFTDYCFILFLYMFLVISLHRIFFFNPF